MGSAMQLWPQRGQESLVLRDAAVMWGQRVAAALLAQT